MNASRKLFLDTTIQIDRLFETPSRRRRIGEKLEKAACYTCTLVLREFKSRVIHTCISLHLIIDESDSDPDVLTRISREFSKSNQSMLLKIYAEVKREAALDRSFDKELAIGTVQSYIRGRLLARFTNVLAEPESDLAECQVARYEVQEKYGAFELRVNCNRTRERCKLAQVYSDNEHHLKRLKALLEAKPGSSGACRLQRAERREFERINEAYSEVLKHASWELLRGQHNCDRLADLSILIESPPGSAVYTTNNDYAWLFDRLAFPEKAAPEIEKWSGPTKKRGNATS